MKNHQGTPAKAAAAVNFADVTKVFPPGKNRAAFVALGGVSVDVDAESFVCLVGPSGCGKSTLLNIAAGLLKPTTGTVISAGSRLEGINPRVGYMTQHNTLLPWRTVAKNVAAPLEIARVPRRERAEKVADALAHVDLSKFANHYPNQLSGGMQRRALLARTLVSDPDILLMDEPFGAVDAQLRLVLQMELLQMWESRRRTVIFVTHDLEEAILLGDRIVVMASQPGRIISVKDTGLDRPRNFSELRETQEFRAVWHELWALLKPGYVEGEREAS